MIVSALDAAGAPAPASLALILSDDAELAELDAAHMGVAGPTDVLSFPLLPPASFPPHAGQPIASARAPDPPGRAGAAGSSSAGRPPPFVLPPARRQHLGDIVVSVERAVDQAAAGRGGQTGDVRWSIRDELRLLVAHGTLHVCGWDHADPVEAAAMRALERRLLEETAER